MSSKEEIATVGATQRFECQVIGFPTPAISWFKDEIDITENPRYNIGYDKERGVITLTIKEVHPSDEGCYQCRAQNTEGYATTTAYLVVRVDHGLSRGFQSMLLSERMSEQELSQVQMSSTDKQTVIEEVITRLEETEKEVIEEKQIPPKIFYEDTLNEELTLKTGSTLYIEVGVSGIPFPEVAWQHNDKSADESARVTVETQDGYSYLKVKGTSQEDSGIYKVTAENAVGKDEAAFNVCVRAPPTPPRNLRVTEVYKDFISLAWDTPEADGGEPIRGYIIEKSLGGGMFVNVAQVPADELEYKVCKLYEGSEYLFRVSAQNKIGTSNPTVLEKPVKAKLPFDPPGPPCNLKVTEYQKDYVTLHWEMPETDGGALITQYIIEKRDVTRMTGMWAIAGTVEGNCYDYKVTKLFTGNSYLFRVFAENRCGPGEPAQIDQPVVAKLPYDKPMPPRNLRATETSTDYIVIEWDVPESDGGTPITGYVIEKRDAKRREYIYIADVAANILTFKATRLFEGYEYFFRVIAENQVGPSDPCALAKPVKAKLPFDEPSAPRNLRVKEYWTDFITITWDKPESDGGAPITGYIIEKRDALRQTWVKAGNVGDDVDTFKVTNLFEGVSYLFRVFAENKVGPSLEWAELDKPCKAKMPFDPPFAPRNLKVTDYNIDHITLAWDAPEHDGGSPITRYSVEKRDAMRATWGSAGATDSDTLTFTADNLFAGECYYFRIAAENQVGRSPYDELTHSIKARLPYDKPGPPSSLHPTDIWKDYIGIGWESPLNDGGSPITGYTIEMRDAMQVGYKFVAQVDAKATAYQVTNLEEGHEYYFRVFSQNKAGLSEKAVELKPPVKAKLPYDKPSAPKSVKVIGTGKGTISIEWEVPTKDGGAPITGYIIELCPTSETAYTPIQKVDAKTLNFDITGLKDGGDYYIGVRSENDAGISKNAAEIELPVTAKAKKKKVPTATLR